MKARDILLGEGLTDSDIKQIKDELEDLMWEYGGKEPTDTDVLKEYFHRKSNRLQVTRARFPRKVEETKEYIERSKMGEEDVRSTAEELRQKAMKRKPKTPEPSPHNSDSEGEEAETLRLKAMKPRKIVEKGLLDFSDVFAEKEPKKKEFPREGLEATGAGAHIKYGEKHHKAKLTNAQATEIRNMFWSKKETNQHTIAKMYELNPSVIRRVIVRETWSHLPQAEGEPDDVYNAPNGTDLRVMKKAKELGVEPVANKIGRLRLPDEAIKEARVKAQIKRTATKMKKKTETKE